MMTTPDYNLIGSRIREARKAAGYTQAELADIIGLTQGMINKIETGLSAVTLDNLYKLSEVLEYPVVYFLGTGVDDLGSDAIELAITYDKLPAMGKELLRKMIRGLLD